jgi:hypothetical protein
MKYTNILEEPVATIFRVGGGDSRQSGTYQPDYMASHPRRL